MAGAGGSGSSSQSSSRSDLGSLNPLAAVLGSLFGLGSRTVRGGLSFGDNQLFDFFGNTGRTESGAGLTGQGARTGAGGPLNASMFDPNAFFQPALTEGAFGIDQAIGSLGSALSTGREAIETGLIEPTQDLFRQTFQEQIIPDLQAQFGGFGLNQNDSDFGASVAREAALGSANIANLAADRRLAASAQAPGFLGSLGGVEDALRGSVRNRNPGVQSFERLLGLAGIGTQGQTSSRSSSSSTSVDANAGVGGKGGS